MLSSLKLTASVSTERAKNVPMWMVDVMRDQPMTNLLSDVSLAN